MKTVLLKSMKIGVDGKIENYDEPIEEGKMEMADGNFLCDSLMGPMFRGWIAKEVEPGVWQSCRNPKHYMYEKTKEEMENA